jgi:hypothetical protein
MFSLWCLVTRGGASLTLLRGKLSTESPSGRQQTFEVGVEAVRGLLVRPGSVTGGMKHFPVDRHLRAADPALNLTGMLPL